MRYGVVLFTSDRGGTPAEVARAAEDAGFDSVAVPEHTHMPVRRESIHPTTGTTDLPDDRYARTLDPWVALATAAAVTTRITLSTAVALPAEHDPIALAKTIASLDHLSGGRVVLGAGFGWNAEELADHGVDRGRRRTVLAEYLGAMRALWSQEEAAFEGEYVKFGPCWAWPKPVRGAGVPVLLGAGGTARTFEWIARHADGWITTPADRDIGDGVRSLRERWQAEGRAGEPQVVALAGKPDPGVLAEWEAAGVTEVLFGLPDRSAEDVTGYIGHLAGKLGLAS
ncbi:LLM class F420-dependent oxidoreductase [Prauserella muralis]|uniref:LLM class F420-dependent oxidoreductase n=1 Tax=Prauserella muralis TaxID=588067 RepID=A0A2V4APC7_9PSEU|nr:LLM class F420-dependent oxidoreductase [Prauserella muralis]PXY22563.1 LLM class F420-dependent oxidoreductase [Prauserella muralis]TWE28253.1 putative F420-dependent oxidoreductase [Prauserella muralis]